MTYRCTVPGSEHEVEYAWREVPENCPHWFIVYRYRGKLYRVTETTWQRDYEAVK